MQLYLLNFSKQKISFSNHVAVYAKLSPLFFQNGTLKIIDRKKHIFKLSQGEYIAPEKVENIYQSSSYVAQVFVHGESLKVKK